MTRFITTKMTDRSVSAAVLAGVSLRGTGLSAAALPVRERSERPIQAPAAVAAAQAQAYAFAAANGAGNQKTQHNLMWAFRGLEPWSDPA
jgi:hypothetical protein